MSTTEGEGKYITAFIYSTLLFQKILLLDNISYEKLEIQPYLVHNSVYSHIGEQIFKWRTRMQNFKSNFSHGQPDLSCPLGCSHVDSQENILKCQVVQKKMDGSSANYFNIFSKNVELILATIAVLQKAVDIRDKITEADKFIILT